MQLKGGCVEVRRAGNSILSPNIKRAEYTLQSLSDFLGPPHNGTYRIPVRLAAEHRRRKRLCGSHDIEIPIFLHLKKNCVCVIGIADVSSSRPKQQTIHVNSLTIIHFKDLKARTVPWVCQIPETSDVYRIALVSEVREPNNGTFFPTYAFTGQSDSEIDSVVVNDKLRRWKRTTTQKERGSKNYQNAKNSGHHRHGLGDVECGPASNTFVGPCHPSPMVSAANPKR